MSGQIVDVTDGDFEQVVLKADVPVLVDFWATWCAPCRALEPTVKALAEKYEGSASMVKIDLDNNPQVAQRYMVRGLPTLILFKDGGEKERIVGAVSKESLSRLIDKHVSAARV